MLHQASLRRFNEHLNLGPCLVRRLCGFLATFYGCRWSDTCGPAAPFHLVIWR